MRIVRVTGAEDLESLYRFRHDVYVDDLGWLPPSSDRMARDVYDDFAFNYAAFDEHDRVVGSVRIVADSPMGLPLERCAPLNGYRSGKTIVEICRLAVHPELHNPRLGGLLMKTGLHRAEMLGASHVLLDVAVETESVRLYEKTGFVRLGPEYIDTHHLGRLRSVTMGQAVAEFHQAWSLQNPGLYRFLTTKDGCIDHG